MYVTRASNGTLISPDLATRLRLSGVDYVEISIDGKDAVSHNTVRGIQGAFDRSIRGIQSWRKKESIHASLPRSPETTIRRFRISMHWPEIWGPADLWGLILSPLVEDPGHGSGYLTTGPFTDCLSTALQLVRVAVETSDHREFRLDTSI